VRLADREQGGLMTLWYLARAAGIVAMIMFTVSAALGILMSANRRPERRFWLQYVHRSAAATGLFLLATHVVAIISDSFVNISPTVLVWPFGAGYRPFAMVVGVLALYGLVLTSVIGAARGRLARSASFTKYWRTMHIAASVGWLLSIGHALLAGTDRSTPWMLAITLSCLAAVAAAGAYRLRANTPPSLVRVRAR
jgi:sulfoxide reductase heme-binding subunit YedZ